MSKSENLSDEVKYQIVAEEIEEFRKLVEGHRKLLMAIGEL